MLTLQQLRIFWSVAHSPSMTQVAKQLGLSQPSLSQAIAKMERSLGGRLFDRVNNRLVLTDAGRFLLHRAEVILAEVDEAEAGLAEFRLGRRARISVGALPSLARSLLPHAYRTALARVPDLELDVHEVPPAEAIEQLYGRNLQIALVASGSIANNRISFARVDVATDRYALAVPQGLVLDRVRDPASDLGRDARETLARCITFNFGNAHTQNLEQWYRRVIPHHRPIAQCRSYETALAMVEAGLGITLVPELAASLNGRALFDVRLYAVPERERAIVALTPAQYLRVDPHRTFLDALKGVPCPAPPPLAPTPPFIERALAAVP